MRKHISVTLVAGTVAALALAMAAGVDAGPRDAKGKARRLGIASQFVMSTEFSGYLGGDMVIEGVRYKLAPETKIYVIGEGLVPQGLSLSGRSVYMSGERVGNVAVVHSVIVRPSSEKLDAEGQSADVGVAPQGRPR